MGLIPTNSHRHDRGYQTTIYLYPNQIVQIRKSSSSLTLLLLEIPRFSFPFYWFSRFSFSFKWFSSFPFSFKWFSLHVGVTTRYYVYYYYYIIFRIIIKFYSISMTHGLYICIPCASCYRIGWRGDSFLSIEKDQF